MFTINSVKRLDWQCGDLVQVTVSIPSKEWHQTKRRGALGTLYGIDIGNAVWRQYGVKSHCPTVSDRGRARGGVKVITLTYVDAAWLPAKVVPKLYLVKAA
jgi:hypothetical protein